MFCSVCLCNIQAVETGEKIYRFQYVNIIVCLFFNAGAKAACPLSINPQPVVLAYGSSHNVTCESSVPSASLSWKYADKVLNESTLVINSNLFTDMLGWSGKASCLGHFVGLDDCQKDLNVIIYSKFDFLCVILLCRLLLFQYNLHLIMHHLFAICNIFNIPFQSVQTRCPLAPRVTQSR